MIWLILLTIAILLFYKYAIQPLSLWNNLGIAHRRPYPFTGNLAQLMFRQKSFTDCMIDVYKEFPNERYNGHFQFTLPVLIIRDLHLIKQISVKDFDHFTDHKSTIDPEVDVLFSKNLLSLTGHKWRDMRATLSPAFTSSKMRAMFTLIADCSEQFTEYFSAKCNKDVVQEFDMKDIFTRYTNDVIATCAFGVKCDSLKDKENLFYMMGKYATNFGGWRGLKFLLLAFFPELFKKLKMRVFPKRISDFFINTISETISVRTEKNIVRPDIIHLLMEAKKGKLHHEDTKEESDKGFAVVEESELGKTGGVNNSDISDLDIAAQAFIFFFAGFETSSVALCFMSHEIAVNPDIQEKLKAEIDDTFEECNRKLTYEAVMGMKYLDMVLSELLRKWPPGPVTDRLCTKEFVIEPTKPGEKRVILEPGNNVFIPIIGLHRDEKYFPDPERFDPERFSEENKHKIVPYSYLPFGVGPRACIGSRFALLEIKVMFIHLLRKFEIVVTDKTTVPLKLSAKSLTAQPENGFWLGFKAR